MHQSPDVDLLPRSLTEILRHTFIVYRQNLRMFLGASAVILIPLTIAQLILTSSFLDGGTQIFTTSADSSQASVDSALLTIFLLYVLLLVFQSILLSGVLTFLVSELLLGRYITPIQALEKMGNRLIPLAIAIVMVGIMIGLVGFIVAILYFLCGLGFGVLIYLIVNLLVLLTPVIILEKVGIFDGIVRTWGLSKRRFWPLLGLFVALILLSTIAFIIQLIGESLVGGVNDSSIAFDLLTLIVSIVFAPFAPIASTLLYYDTRIRLEGLDIALESLDKPDPRPSDVPSPYIPLSLNRSDVKDIVIVSVAAIFLVLFLGVIILATTGITLPETM